MWGEYTVCKQGTNWSKAEIIITWWRDTERDRELQGGVTVLCGRVFGHSSGFDSHHRSSQPASDQHWAKSEITQAKRLMVSEDIGFFMVLN